MGEDGQVRQRLTYLGRPVEARLLRATLEEYGVEVQWEPPQERRDFAGTVEPVFVDLVAAAPEVDIRHAVAKFKERLPGADVEIEDDDPPAPE